VSRSSTHQRHLARSLKARQLDRRQRGDWYDSAPEVIQTAHDNPHPLIETLGGHRWCFGTVRDEYLYGCAVLSICFYSLDAGHYPFIGDLADSLNAEGIPTARGHEWTSANLYELFKVRHLMPYLVEYRTTNNLAYLQRVNQVGRGAITRHAIPAL
jgi:hypothetical protein